MAGILYLLHVFRNTYSACRSFSILRVQNEADLDRTLGGKNRSGSFIIDRKQGLVTGSNHGWKQRLCRVQNSLPSVKNRALGKDLLCRVLHSANTGTRQMTSLSSARLSAKSLHSAKSFNFFEKFLCRVPTLQALGKVFLFFF